MDQRPPRHVTVTVPATTANLGAGFDALGLALALTNQVHVGLDGHGYEVIVHGDDNKRLPTDSSHLIIQTMLHFYRLNDLSPPPGIRVQQHIDVPLSGGLGSSATAIVSGILAASALSGANWDVNKVLQLASSLEGHPDNVAPALFGGLVTSITEGSGHVIAMPVPVHPAWRPTVVLAIPEFQLTTAEARTVLRPVVNLGDATYNVGRAALFVAAAAAGRTDCLHECMDDRLHQSCRGTLIPGLEHVFRAAMHAGALGVALSGAGPTVLAFAEQQQAPKVGAAMVEAFALADVRARALLTNVCFDGATTTVN